MTLANRITVFRLLLIPVFLVTVMSYTPDKQWLRLSAAGIFLVAALSDILDGFVARAYDQLGTCYFAAKRPVDAELAWASAVAADPTHHAPYLKLIDRRLDTGDRAGARAIAVELRRHGGALTEALRRRLKAAGGRLSS